MSQISFANRRNKRSASAITLIVLLFGVILWLSLPAHAQDTLSATHSASPSEYVAGQTVTITNQITYTGSLSALGVEVVLPAGWTYADKGGDDQPAVYPASGDSGTLGFAWIGAPSSTADFTYTVNVPSSATCDQQLVATIIYRRTGGELTEMAAPNPLVVTKQNNAPTADAGPDQTVQEGALVTLDGSNSSDPDAGDTIASYKWNQTDGPVVQLSDDSIDKPTFTAPATSPLTFELTVTDSCGLTGTDTVIVNVAVNAPNADAGPDQTVGEGTAVTLDGSNSSDPDPGDSITAYLWNQTAGTSQVTLSDTTVQKPTFAAPTVGQGGEALTFELTVTDSFGSQGTDAVIINVSNINNAPTADAGPDQAAAPEGATVTLDGSASTDPDIGEGDSIASYLWKLTAGTAVTLSDATVQKPSFTAPDVGLGGEALTFELTVTDSFGPLAGTDTVIINVSNINNAPTADAGPVQTVDEGETVTLDGSASTDPDIGEGDSIASYLWTQTAGTSVTFSDPTAVKPTFVSPPVDAAGTDLTFELTVTDQGGLAGTADVTVTVNDNGITGFPEDALTTTTATGENIGLTQTGGNITSLETIDPATIEDSVDKPEDMIYGLLNMTFKADATGGTVEVTIYLPEPAPEDYIWYKYDPATGWYDFSANAAFNDDRTEVTLTLTDGGDGDHDGAANGMIVDPSGLGKGAEDDSGICFISSLLN